MNPDARAPQDPPVPPATPGEPPMRSLRLTFAYRDASIRLVRSEPLEKQPPATDPLAGYEGRSGFWIELRDGGGAVIYRRCMRHPIRRTLEVHQPGESPPHYLVARTDIRGRFMAIVPDLDAAGEVVVVGDPLDPPAGGGTVAVELARFPLAGAGAGPDDTPSCGNPPNGTVGAIKKIIDNGDVLRRVNVVFLSEGYTANELSLFHRHVMIAIDHLFTVAPYTLGGVRNAINFFWIDVASTESGSSFPAREGSEDCGGNGQVRRTFFNTRFCGRVISGNDDCVAEVCKTLLPEWNHALVLVNSTTHGGTSYGDTVCYSSVAEGFADTVVHELGHNIYNLADEYPYWLGCDKDGPSADRYSGGEPVEANATIDTGRSTNKWRAYIRPETPMPTQTNPDCARCDNASSPVGQGVVGTFEGARYFHCGVYRPEHSCIMRESGSGRFCTVCNARIREVLRDHGTLYTPIPWLVFYLPSGQTWTPGLEEDRGLPPFPPNVYGIECTATDTQLLVCILDQAELYYNIGTITGHFANDFARLSDVSAGLGEVCTVVTCGRVGSQLFVLAVGDGVLRWTAYSTVSARWNRAWADVPGVEGVVNVSCSGVGTQLHVCVTTGDRLLATAYLTTSGAWQGAWTNVASVSSGLSGLPGGVSTAAVGSNLALLVSAEDRILQTTFFTVSGTWQPAFADVTAQVAGLTALTDMDCAAVDGQLYLVVMDGSTPVYAVRDTAGQWSPAFQPVQNLTVGPGGVGCISCAEMPSKLLVCAGVQSS